MAGALVVDTRLTENGESDLLLINGVVSGDWPYSVDVVAWIYYLQCISREAIMQVAKWGNSLAVRLPATVVEALELKEGDEIEIHVAGSRSFGVKRDRSREVALERIRALRKSLPPGWRFDREEANIR